MRWDQFTANLLPNLPVKKQLKIGYELAELPPRVRCLLFERSVGYILPMSVYVGLYRPTVGRVA